MPGPENNRCVIVARFRPKTAPAYSLAGLCFAIVSTAPLSACQQLPQKQASHMTSYSFLVGPPPEHNRGKDERFVAELNTRYLAAEDMVPTQPRPLPHVTFAVRYPSMEPVAKTALGGPGVVIVGIVWEQSGSIQRRVDGSWLNHFSIYDRPTGERFGLRVRQRTDFDQSLLYVSPDQQTLIECIQGQGQPPQRCQALRQLGSHAVLEVNFPPERLQDWQVILKKTSDLIVLK